MSPASSTSKASDLHDHVIAQLIERGRSQGYLEADDVRRTFEEADIPVAKDVAKWAKTIQDANIKAD